MSHCWADYHEQFPFGSHEWAEHYLDTSATCLLQEGHDGPHEWTPDDQIVVTFPEAEG